MNAKLFQKTCVALLPAVSMLFLVAQPAWSQFRVRPQRLVLDGRIREVKVTGTVVANLFAGVMYARRVGHEHNALHKVRTFIAEPGEISIQGFLYPVDTQTNTPVANHTDPSRIHVRVLYARDFKCTFVLHRPPRQNRPCIIPSRQRVYMGRYYKQVRKSTTIPRGLRDVVVISGPAAKNLSKATYVQYRAAEISSRRNGGDRLPGGTGNKCVGSAFNGC